MDGVQSIVTMFSHSKRFWSMVQKEEIRVVLHSDQTKPRRSSTRRRPVEEAVPTVLVGGVWRVLGFPVWSTGEFQRLGGELALELGICSTVL